jgi:hypothetical protein
VLFTDGLCPGCAVRVKRDGDEAPETFEGLGVWLRPAMAAAATAVLLLSPQSIDQGPARLFKVQAALMPPPAAAEESEPAPAAETLVSVAPVLALVSGAAGASDGPVVESVSPSPSRRPAPPRNREARIATPPSRASIPAYPDPASPLATLCTQAP